MLKSVQKCSMLHLSKFKRVLILFSCMDFRTSLTVVQLLYQFGYSLAKSEKWMTPFHYIIPFLRLSLSIPLFEFKVSDLSPFGCTPFSTSIKTRILCDFLISELPNKTFRRSKTRRSKTRRSKTRQSST